MGSSNSRLGLRSSRPSRPNDRLIKRALRSLVCGASNSTPPNTIPVREVKFRRKDEMEDYQLELLTHSPECHNSVVVDRLQSSEKNCSSIIDSENECSCSSTESRFLSDQSCSTSTSEAFSFGCSSKCTEVSNADKCQCGRKKSVADVLDVKYSPRQPYLERTDGISSSSSLAQRDIGCSSSMGQSDIGFSYSQGECSIQSASMGSSSNTSVNVGDALLESDSGVCQERVCSSSLHCHELEDIHTDGLLTSENLTSSTRGVHVVDASSVPGVADSSATPTQDDIAQPEASRHPEHFMSSMRQDRRNGNILHVDVVSISSEAFFSSTGEISNREVRRNSRRLFWDAFSRRSSSRHSDYQTILLSSEDTNDPGSHDRWLLDFSADLFEEEDGNDTGFSGGRSHSINQGRWRSRSEYILSYGKDYVVVLGRAIGELVFALLVSILMALAPVLDEIHRQPASVSLSMMSLPAPESVVDSFPLKSHKGSSASETGEVEQFDDNLDENLNQLCYICLSEYEEGDKIRVLPCHHEYHMICVDKWLKEIHGVCPLCRGDVCEGVAESSVFSS
ncbi:hypothetical protein Scep_023876 [Stephania cephalantha]|uniref:RING-type domain-containing protein n=1 Tax=Stephania cephalantha TaxID=152367 RepID=A0AAP0EVH5_9MAGN